MMSCGALNVNRLFGGTSGLWALHATCFILVSSSAYFSAVKTGITCFSETSVDFQRTTRRCIPVDRSHTLITVLNLLVYYWLCQIYVRSIFCRSSLIFCTQLSPTGIMNELNHLPNSMTTYSKAAVLIFVRMEVLRLSDLWNRWNCAVTRYSSNELLNMNTNVFCCFEYIVACGTVTGQRPQNKQRNNIHC
jgi:hypothetical protein